MLSAANENVLMAVDFLSFERTSTHVANVARYTSPSLSIQEVETILEMLRRDGYVRCHPDDDVNEWSLTEAGRREAQHVSEKELSYALA